MFNSSPDLTRLVGVNKYLDIALVKPELVILRRREFSDEKLLQTPNFHLVKVSDTDFLYSLSLLHILMVFCI